MHTGPRVAKSRRKLTFVVAALTVSGCARIGDATLPKSRILTCLEQAQSASNVRLAESRSGGPSG